MRKNNPAITKQLKEVDRIVYYTDLLEIIIDEPDIINCYAEVNIEEVKKGQTEFIINLDKIVYTEIKYKEEKSKNGQENERRHKINR